jgi:hypothetical protein
MVRADPIHTRQDHCDRAACRRRHEVETLRARPKERRGIAIRWGKTAASFTGTLFAAVLQQLS